MAIRNKTHLRNKILQLIRKLTWQWTPIKEAEDLMKVDAATFECELCGLYIYKGTSQKNLKALQEKYPDKVVEKGILYHDHIEPVIPVDKKTKDLTLDEIVDRMFCESEGIQILCKCCHDEKTRQEDEERKK